MLASKKIAIIGSGAAGLTSIKACKEEGLNPVCFERKSHIGGLWHYHDEDLDDSASVMDSTVMNSSKDMSAFTDFPPPAQFPNYMHHSLVLKYFEQYADKFDLIGHVKFNHDVLKVAPAGNYNATGRWVVTARNMEDNTQLEEVFDGVMLCSGHHILPNVPTFPGQEDFKGQIVHSHSLKSVKGFAGKKVVVVGIGNSGGDVAVDVCNFAEKTYASTRRGTWIISRVGLNGYPSDATFQRRINDVYLNFYKYDRWSKKLEKMLNTMVDHTVYGLQPAHRFLSQHPTINDALPSKLITGLVKLKGDIKKFTEEGVIFQGENQVTEIDAAIMATGYRIAIPFLREDIIPITDNRVELYKNVFPPTLDHPSLCVIGLVQPNGALFPVFEMQARWYALVMNKKLHLPSKVDMLHDVRRKRMLRSSRYIGSPRHTIEEDWLPCMDNLAEIIGAKPNLWRMLITDPKLFWMCLMGPCLPYQYRLTGPHSWPGAREAILKWKTRMECPLKSRDIKKCDNTEFPVFLLVVFLGIFLVLLWKFPI